MYIWWNTHLFYSWVRRKKRADVWCNCQECFQVCSFIHTVWRLKPWSRVPRIGVNLLLWENLERIILWPTCMFLHNGCMTVALATILLRWQTPVLILTLTPNSYHNPYFILNQKPKHWSKQKFNMNEDITDNFDLSKPQSWLLPAAHSYRSNYRISCYFREFRESEPLENF